MKKKIKSSIFAKVFLITMFFLLCMGMLVYGLLAWLMPKAYSNSLSQDLDEQAKGLIAELEQVPFSGSGSLFYQFWQKDGIQDIELYTENGNLAPLPFENAGAGSYQAEAFADQNIAVYEGGSDSEESEMVCGSYFFSFAGNPARYMLLVYGKAGQIGELKSAFFRMFPILLGIAALAALAVSWLYAYIITKPLLKLSRIAQKMSDLNLEWEIGKPRSDELGQLEKSLHFLSQKLAATILDLQSANQQLSADIEREKALEQAQLDFFSAVSHELKTPITIIKGQLEGMLLGVGAYKDHGKYLARSLEITNTMESMVQEILTVARLESNVTENCHAPFECTRIIWDYLSENEGLILNKALQVHCTMPQQVLISGSKPLMEKVFSNLIGNAIKYAPQGAEVSISIQAAPAPLDTPPLSSSPAPFGHPAPLDIAASQSPSAALAPQSYIFSFENTGAHIPEACIPKLFEAFYRVDSSRNRKTGGSGLGLYLVQKILHQHKSRCFVTNTESGVCFSFTFPSAVLDE